MNGMNQTHQDQRPPQRVVPNTTHG